MPNIMPAPTRDHLAVVGAHARSVARLFRYRRDAGGDAWTSHVSDYREGRTFHGDCDDFAMTLIDVLVSHRIVGRDHLGVATCRLRGSGQYHAMVTVTDDQRRLWAFDNLDPGGRLLDEACLRGYLEIRAARAAALDEWHWIEYVSQTKRPEG